MFDSITVMGMALKDRKKAGSLGKISLEDAMHLSENGFEFAVNDGRVHDYKRKTVREYTARELTGRH